MRMTRQPNRPAASRWLRNYYFVRAAFSIAWVAVALAVGRQMPLAAAALLVAYPAWDAIANLVDARRNGGLSANRSQSLNVTASAVTTLAVAVALGLGPNEVLAVFGVWAILSGLFQLLTGVRRWRMGAQWAMVLSGAQSGLAGAYMLIQATGSKPASIADIAPYAAFGAFYFLVSAVWLTVSSARQRKAGLA
ncbi:DUF308 domain-containing protein [Hansschlegelia sp. KR7-227]|uniref:DUF308 domain-containing protein n=1 Tax=Hansschlegelia sp. KR7-227 TaxID=3400914 RepID=UPI003C080FC3